MAASADGDASAAVFSGWPRKKSLTLSPNPGTDADVLPVVAVGREPNMSVEQPANTPASSTRHVASERSPLGCRLLLVAGFCIVPSVTTKVRPARVKFNIRTRSSSRPSADTNDHSSMHKWRNIVPATRSLLPSRQQHLYNNGGLYLIATLAIPTQSASWLKRRIAGKSGVEQMVLPHAVDAQIFAGVTLAGKTALLQ
jgi:hypothetical protein